MIKDEIIFCNMRDIPGFEGKYKANPYGQIVRFYKHGKTRLMSQFRRHGVCMVKLTIGGKSRNIVAAALIAHTFLGKAPSGMVLHHKNGMRRDNRLDNLAYISRHNLGKKTGHRSGSRSVLKISEAGEVVDCYYSAREAARNNNMSYQTVMDRCNGKVKKPFALDGHTYQWEDSKGDFIK